jgi:excisionase family DNA binding protein
MRHLATIPRHRHYRMHSVRGARHARDSYTFAPLLDAKAASALLGVPPSWLLAQARVGRVPHHRLGHYVRFSGDDLHEWLSENRITPDSIRSAGNPRSR